MDFQTELFKVGEVVTMSHSKFWWMILGEHLEILLSLINDPNFTRRLEDVQQEFFHAYQPSIQIYNNFHALLSQIKLTLAQGGIVSNNSLPPRDFFDLVNHILGETIYYLETLDSPSMEFQAKFWSNEVFEHSKLILRHVRNQQNQDKLRLVISDLESYIDNRNYLRGPPSLRGGMESLESVLATEPADRLFIKMVLHELKETVFARAKIPIS